MEWRSAVRWPPFPPHIKPYYLSGQNLSWQKLGDQDIVRTYKYDPADPCPTAGGANLTIPSGPLDQRSVSSRPDVLVFTEDTLEAPMEVTGEVTVRLFVSTDAPDTDFTAKLVDVYPKNDGREILVTDNIRRLRFRKSYSKSARPLKAGEVVELDVELGNVSWIFNTGHCVALHISSSNFPRFEVNPNTGEDFPVEGATRVAANSVHMQARYDSALLLPVRQPDLDADKDGTSDEVEWDRGTYTPYRKPWLTAGGCNTCWR
jgi:hypothetical protein